MDAYDILLGLHVAAGAIALLLGPLALRAERRPPHASRVGGGYQWAVLAVALSAGALAAFDWATLWWLSLLAALSYGLALLGVLASRRRPRGWVRAYAHGQGGSYIALVTALLVVSLDGAAATAAWFVPTLVGLPLIERRVGRLSRPTPATRCPPAGARAA